MRRYFQFLLIGLILGLFTEVQLKFVAGINPAAFLVAMAVYPVILTLMLGVGELLDRTVPSVWTADLLHYLIGGVGGLAFEWFLLGNDPGSNAFQPGMFAMWTTFCFGPRVLTRSSIGTGVRKFWTAFAVVALLMTAFLLIVPPDTGARVVLAVYGLSLSYAVWSVWLLVLARKSTRDSEQAV